MVVVWLDRAEARLREIYDYYLAVAGEKTARKIAAAIVERADTLGAMPFSAPVEPLLEGRPEGFRSKVVKGSHKIVYYVADEKVNIATVFDCRRDPSRLRNEVPEP